MDQTHNISWQDDRYDTLFTHVTIWIYYQALLNGFMSISRAPSCDKDTENLFISVKDQGRQIWAQIYGRTNQPIVPLEGGIGRTLCVQSCCFYIITGGYHCLSKQAFCLLCTPLEHW